MDVVIKLDHTQDYQPEMGAAFMVEFEKARHLSGDDARNLEASLARDQQDTAPVRAIQALGSANRISAKHCNAGLYQRDYRFINKGNIMSKFEKGTSGNPGGRPGGLGAIAAR